MILAEDSKHRVSLRAYAKINLGLNIVGRRADGYHLLETVMQSVSLADRIVLTAGGVRGEIRAEVSGDAPRGPDNLAVRAAALFFEHTGIPNPGLTVKLKKNIPAAAGLGGGSADAAGVLAGLNRLFDAGLDTDELCRMGETLGADVPFCLVGGTCLAEGTGGILTPLPPLKSGCFVVAKIGEKPSTAEMYRRFDETDGRPAADIRKLTHALCAGDVAAAGRHTGNAFFDLWRDSEAAAAAAFLTDNGAAGAGLSGSGPSVFGLFEDARTAAECRAALRKRFSEVFLCRPEPCGVVFDD